MKNRALNWLGWFGLASALCAACSSDQGSPSASGGAPEQAGSAVSSGGGGGSGGSAGSLAQPGGGGGNASGGSAGASGAPSVAGANAAGVSGAAGTAGSGGAPSGGSGGVAPSGGAGGSTTALEPCAEPSVSRLKVWETQVVGGSMVPASGSPLRAAAGGHELYIEWTLQGGGAYGTANAPLNNKGQYTNGADPAAEAVDLSAAPGFALEYATTGSSYVQLRTGSVPHGGDHFRADLPNTQGQLQTVTLAFSDFRRPGGNTPPASDVLSDVFSFTFVAAGSTSLTLRQVLIPGFVPPCE